MELPFPESVRGVGAIDNELADLHVDLALYDNCVGGVIRRVVEGYAVPEDMGQLLIYDDTLERRLQQIVQRDPTLNHELRYHYRYLMRIKKLLNLASASVEECSQR